MRNTAEHGVADQCTGMRTAVGATANQLHVSHVGSIRRSVTMDIRSVIDVDSEESKIDAFITRRHSPKLALMVMSRAEQRVVH